MIGLVLVTHGHLATEFRAALEHVVGPQANLATIAIAPDDDMEGRRRDIIAAVDASGITLMCAHNQLFLPPVAKARELLAS